MKKIIVCGTIIGSMILAGCAGGRKQVRTFSGALGEMVKAEGVAPIVDGDVLNARKAALADAQKNAVEVVVGVYVTAQTMVQKAVIITSDILTKTEGYVTRYDVIKEGRDGDMYKVTIQAVVKLEEINKDLDGLGLLVTPEEAGNPRVSIIVEEEVNGEASASGDAEMALFTAMLDANYPMVEATQLNEKEIDRALEGNASFYRIIGEKLQVEFLIIGNVAASLVTREGLGGFISYRASANVKTVRCADGKVIAAVSDVQSGIDITESAAAAKALKAAASAVGRNIAQELAARVKQDTLMSLEIENLPSIQTLRELQNFLGTLPEVTATQVRQYANGKAYIDIYLKQGTPQDIAEHLLTTSRWELDIRSVGAHELNAAMKDE